VAKKKIKARELLSDIRAGMDDAGLMEKYGISGEVRHFSPRSSPGPEPTHRGGPHVAVGACRTQVLGQNCLHGGVQLSRLR